MNPDALNRAVERHQQRKQALFEERSVPPAVAARLEQLSDNLESEARALSKDEQPETINELMGLAWNIKQLARKGTPSFGI